jgi:hypothetical protein
MTSTPQTYKKNYKNIFRAALMLCGFCEVLCMLTVNLAAQTKPSRDKADKSDKSKEQPLELPEFIITGVESIDVPGGAKQAPTRSARLTQDELDRFNPLEKQSLRLLPAPPPRPRTLEHQQYQGFLRAEFGMFLTPALEAGYHATAGEFDLYGRVHGVYSQGHLPNAGFTDFGGSLTASYIAPEKFFFFGGSKTDSYIHLRSRSYQGFAADPAMSFATLEFGGGLVTKGTFESLSYDMGLSFEQMNTNAVSPQDLGSTTFSTMNPLIAGHLAAAANLENVQLGGLINLELQSQQRSNLPTAAPFFGQAVVTAEYRILPSAQTKETSDGGVGVVVAAELGGQLISGLASSTGLPASSASSVVAFVAKLRAELQASPLFTLRAGAETGYEPLSVQSLVRQNPYFQYVDVNALLFPRTVYALNAGVTLHPTQALMLALDGRLRSIERIPVFEPLFSRGTTLSGAFSSVPVNAAISSAEAELLWNVSNLDAVTVHTILNAGPRPLPTKDKAIFNNIPYLAPIQASVSYRRQWSEAFSTKLGLTYMGERPTNITSAATLPAFIDLTLGAEYAFSSRFNVFVRGENLLNQRIFIWEGYQERGIFVAAGVVWKF